MLLDCPSHSIEDTSRCTDTPPPPVLLPRDRICSSQGMPWFALAPLADGAGEGGDGLEGGSPGGGRVDSTCVHAHAHSDNVGFRMCVHSAQLYSYSRSRLWRVW